MSEICFETKTGRAKVHFKQWYEFAAFMEETTSAFLKPKKNKKLLKKAIHEDHYLAEDGEEMSPKAWVNEFEANMEDDGDGFLSVNGKILDVTDLRKNTVLAQSNDSLKLVTILYDQSHGGSYVLGKNRSWLADIIETNSAGMFTEGYGWDKIIELLRESSEETMFISYPGVAHAGNWDAHLEWCDKEVAARGMDPDDFDTIEFIYTELDEYWESFGVDKQWEIVESWLSRNPNPNLEISPERFASGMVYGDGMDAGKLMDILKKQQWKSKI